MMERIFSDSEHEENVQKYGRQALLDWMRSKTIRTYHIFLSYYSFSLNLSSEAEKAADDFQTLHFHCSPETASKNTQQYKEKALKPHWKNMLPSSLMPFISIPFLGLLFWRARGDSYRYHPYWMLSTLLITAAISTLLIALTTVRTRARRRARRAYGDSVKTLEAYCDIQARSLLQNMRWQGICIVAAVMLAAGLGAYVLDGPATQNRLVTDIVNDHSWEFPVAELDRELLTNNQLTEKSRALLDRALGSYKAGSEEALKLAVYAQMKVKNGYPEDIARQTLIDQIAAMDETAYYQSDAIESLMTASPWTRRLLFDKYRDSDEYRASSMLKQIAKSCGDLPLEERLEWALAIESTHYTAAEFFSTSLTAADLSALGALLIRLSDPEQQRLCAHALADQPNSPEEIVPILYQIRQRGQALGEIFPQRIRLTLDLSALNQTAGLPIGEASPADGRYLIVSRTEQGMKAQQLKAQPDEGYSCHDKADPAAFDVWVETAWMDQLSLDRLPASYAECEWLIVKDTQYIYEGCITDLKDYATGRQEQDQYWYPVYGCLCRLMLVEKENLAPQRLISTLSLAADMDQTVSRWTNVGIGTSMASYQVVPRLDSSWADDALRQFLDSL